MATRMPKKGGLEMLDEEYAEIDDDHFDGDDLCRKRDALKADKEKMQEQQDRKSVV